MVTETIHENFLTHEPDATMSIVAGGSVAEAVGGIGAAVLAILGLSGLLPEEMAAIATIALGAALLLESIAIATRFSELLHRSERNLSDAAKLGIGMGAEFLGGVAAGILGLLALLGIVPMVLMAIGIIVLGTSLLLSSGATYRLDSLATKVNEKKILTGAQVLAGVAASGSQVLVGIAGIALGILGLVGISSMILILVGLLSIGAAVLVSGSAVSSTIATSLMQKQ
jgi:hypothetical protein